MKSIKKMYKKCQKLICQKKKLKKKKMEPISENSALELFKKYLDSVVSRDTDFIFLRVPITKAQVIENNRPVPCKIDLKNKSIVIGTETTKDFPLNTIEQIAWGSADGPTGALKYIQISIKGDKPVILHGQIDMMELWFDELNVIFKKQPETQTSKNKIEVFKTAIKYANKPFPEQVLEIPPPPKDYNFVTKLDIE